VVESGIKSILKVNDSLTELLDMVEELKSITETEVQRVYTRLKSRMDQASAEFQKLQEQLGYYKVGFTTEAIERVSHSTSTNN
jgi:hypothetical protein